MRDSESLKLYLELRGKPVRFVSRHPALSPSAVRRPPFTELLTQCLVYPVRHSTRVLMINVKTASSVRSEATANAPTKLYSL